MIQTYFKLVHYIPLTLLSQIYCCLFPHSLKTPPFSALNYSCYLHHKEVKTFTSFLKFYLPPTSYSDPHFIARNSHENSNSYRSSNPFQKVNSSNHLHRSSQLEVGLSQGHSRCPLLHLQCLKCFSY